MPFNNYQNFHFDDQTTTGAATTSPLTFTDDGVSFTFSSVINTHNFTKTAVAGTEGGTTANPTTLAGPTKIEGVLITAFNTPSAAVTLTAGAGNTFYGSGTPNASGLIAIAFGGGMQPVGPGWSVALKTTGGTLAAVPIPTAPLPQIISLTDPAGVTVTGIRLTYSGAPNGQLFVNGLTASVSCFCAGTSIACPGGDKAVQDLKPGDRILRADGGTTTVRWLGEQPIDTRLSHPAKVNPICITAGAIADGIPSRDLWISADHAVEVDGMLINAGALVNGETIYQAAKMPLDGFTYYHVETEGGHVLILAEGIAAESYIDYVDADGFANADERDGRVIAEMDLPRISASRLVPDAIRARILERAGTPGGREAA